MSNIKKLSKKKFKGKCSQKLNQIFSDILPPQALSSFFGSHNDDKCLFPDIPDNDNYNHDFTDKTIPRIVYTKPIQIHKTYIIASFGKHYGICHKEEGYDDSFCPGELQYNLIDNYLFFLVQKIQEQKKINQEITIDSYGLLKPGEHKKMKSGKRVAKFSPFNFYNLLQSIKYYLNSTNPVLDTPQIINFEDLLNQLKEEDTQSFVDTPHKKTNDK